ncbi:hypothetical protein H8L32_04220 [Undibacterium sp. CY18W]|uniref:Uncharacterized protein n=1 Tax=Undibacterium hunanense TaxID=2762292 RepID=A0ABR6ZLA4_9BURK|nr:hypothetical protein [Undibacterium hunanense]MBC3916683.1 hypothetical protein [Undibacterium hunanense]
MIKRNLQKILCCLLLLTNTKLFASTSETVLLKEHAVVEFRVDEGQDRNFYPLEVLVLIQEKGDLSLVKRSFEHPKFEVFSSRENELLKQVAWIASSKLIRAKEFRRLSRWNGQDKLIYCLASCDSGTDYVFAKDGSFKSTHEYGNSSEDLKPVVSFGHLYQVGNFVWARPNKNNPQFFHHAVFILGPDKSLCDFISCFASLK